LRESEANVINRKIKETPKLQKLKIGKAMISSVHVSIHVQISNIKALPYIAIIQGSHS